MAAFPAYVLYVDNAMYNFQEGVRTYNTISTTMEPPVSLVS